MNIIHKQSNEFLEIMKIKPEKRYLAIREITHSKPLLVFWVTPNGEILDAKDAHHDNPPKGDRSVLSNTNNLGHLRGRAAYFGNIIYIFIYGKNLPKSKKDTSLSKYQIKLLKSSYKSLLEAIKNKNPHIKQVDLDIAQFRTELGEEIK
jgi:hypothetical protein